MKRRRRKLEGAAATYQERRLGVSTPEEYRLPANLMVSDLGLWSVPADARDVLPEGVVWYQVVDAHHGYAAAEAELLRRGFGAARSWHYQALGHPQSFHDAEGRLVTRWIRLFRRGPRRGELVAWNENPPARENPPMGGGGDTRKRGLERGWREGAIGAAAFVTDAQRQGRAVPVEALAAAIAEAPSATADFYHGAVRAGQAFSETLGALAILGDEAAERLLTGELRLYSHDDTIARALRNLHNRVGWPPEDHLTLVARGLGPFFAVLTATILAEGLWNTGWGRDRNFDGAARRTFGTARRWLAGDEMLRGAAMSPEPYSDVPTSRYIHDFMGLEGLDFALRAPTYPSQALHGVAIACYFADLDPEGVQQEAAWATASAATLFSVMRAVAAHIEVTAPDRFLAHDRRFTRAWEIVRAHLHRHLFAWVFSSAPGRWELPPTDPIIT